MASSDRYVVDPAITARVDGAVDTLAFQIKFSGYTDSLRKFIESLTAFEMPVIVRSVEVERKLEVEEELSSSASRRNQRPNSVESLFAGLGETPSVETEAEEPNPEQEVIVDQIGSEFTIVVEYIDIVLDTQAEEVEEL